MSNQCRFRLVDLRLINYKGNTIIENSEILMLFSTVYTMTVKMAH